MRLKTVQKEIKKVLEVDYEFNVDYDFKDDMLSAKCTITLQGCQGSIFVDVTAFESGSFAIDFVFDKFTVTDRSMELLNAFNDHQVWLRARVRNDGYLTFSHNVVDAVTESNTNSILDFIMYQLVKDENLPKIAELTEYTYE